MSFPVVLLESIPTHGLSVAVGDWALPGVAEGLGGQATRVGGQLQLTRAGRHIRVQGTLQGAGTVACDRCGEPLAFDAAGPVDCAYLPLDELAAPAVDEQEPEDAPEQGEYDGVQLDLVHVIREFFALERPARLLCQDVSATPDTADAACLARYRAAAGAPPSPPDPRFAVLKGVKPTR